MVRDHNGTIGPIRERVAMHDDADTTERRAYGDGPSCNSPTRSPVDAFGDHDCRQEHNEREHHEQAVGLCTNDVAGRSGSR